MGDPADQHQGIIDIGPFLELEVVDSRGDDVVAGMPPGHHAGHHIDPFHQLAAEKAARSVDVLGH